MQNLYVTSTLTISSDSYQQSSQPRLAMEERENEPVSVHQDEPVSRPTPSISLENGIEPVSVHQDEIMTEVEEAAVDDDDMTIDMETIEEIVRSSEANSTASGGS